MRIHSTIEFEQRQQAWKDACALHDTFAEAGDDGVRSGGTAEADAAGKAMDDALDTFLLAPAVTAAEVGRKIGVIATRYDTVSLADLQAETKQLQLDLLTLMRPNASPRMVEAFDRWACDRQAHCENDSGDEAIGDALFRAELAAFTALINTPCTTPGDFIVKSYVDLLDEVGGIPEGELNGMTYWPFQPSIEGFDNRGGSNDLAAQAARYQDLKDCDLGRCMIALGMTDFDAEMWIAQARRIGKKVGVTIQSAESDRPGERGLFFSFVDRPIDRDMDDLLQCIMAGGLSDISTARCEALADAIEANHPDLVTDYRNIPAHPAQEPVSA